MKSIAAGDAGKNLSTLLGETASSHEPIQILCETANGVLVSEEDWRAIQETIYLLSQPGMRESIREGMETPIEQCDEELRW
ncbi:MAG: type II toxin-antitoxin system Phd/YefM family antitoxin [Planctomycetota bacterium]|nr:type II toxin-antitoxin system Phd/YefM family antitoxin [Planctomycetota bacterium]MDA1211593.1 type II toxin-antitoxin system Phd/YefM family antitoxin [Planctomycetota bacterium]